MSYLGRSGSAEGDGHIVLGGCGAGAGGALPCPFFSGEEFVPLVRVGHVLPEECVGGGPTLKYCGGKGA